MSVRRIRIKKGLDLPITGAPDPAIRPGPPVRTVAVQGDDYAGMRPTMEVGVGDQVRKGQLLFTDKKNEGVRFTAPGAGRVSAVHRGAKRRLQAVVIDLDAEEAEETFEAEVKGGPRARGREGVQSALVQSGLWTALRARPYGKVPALGSVPHSIFVTAMETRPLGISPEPVIREHAADFRTGLYALAELTGGKLWLCTAPDSGLPAPEVDAAEVVEFAGPHPAGLPGTHIHFLDPVGPHKSVWHVHAQDVIAIGKLFTTGRLWTERVVSIGGPSVSEPCTVRTRLGASIEDLTAGRLEGDRPRVVSGSVLAGRQATGPFAWLGRYHLQVSALPEGDQRVFLGWLSPGLKKFSVKNVVLSRLFPKRSLALSTSKEGSARAMVPIGTYEQVMPLDIIPTYLLRSLIVEDTAEAQALGCLELDEEDVALCTYVCPGKYDYGPILRRNLETIEREG